MMAKPMKTLELHYPMIQFLIILDIPPVLAGEYSVIWHVQTNRMWAKKVWWIISLDICLVFYLFIYLYIIIHKSFRSLWMCMWKIKKNKRYKKKAVLLNATKIK